MQTQTYTLSAVGQTLPIPIEDSINRHPQVLPPGLLVIVSPGANLTYNIEETGDGPAAAYGYGGSDWNAFNGMSGLTASVNRALSGRVSAIRLNVTAWTSGSVTIQVIQ